MEEIAVFREGEEGEPGTYNLKPIFMCEYDPYFKHLTREEHNKLREKYITNRVRNYTRDKKPHPPLNELGPLIENFELVREILLSPALLEILRPLLDRQKQGRLASDVRSACLHLLGLGMMYLDKKRRDGQSAICIQFLRAFTLRHPCGLKEMLIVGSGIEDGSVLSSLLHLYQNLQEGSLNEDLVEHEACEFVFWLISTVTDAQLKASNANFT